jgi:hypothetical protein
VPSRDGSTFTTLDPTTNAPLAEVADGKSADIDAAVAAARRAFDDGPWPRLPAAERARMLRWIADTIRAHAQELIEHEVRDIGMPISQIHGLAARAAQNFDYFAGVLPELDGRSFQVGEEFVDYTVRRPGGVTGMIMPWNAPLMLSMWRIAPALAAGNTIVLKPAEWSPLTATRMSELVQEAGVPDGVLNYSRRRSSVRCSWPRRSRRGGGDPPRQRDAVRPGGVRVDQRHQAGPPRRARDRHRHVLDQLAERARPAHAVRRRQGVRHRPRGRRRRVRVLLRRRGRPRRAQLPRDPEAGDVPADAGD